MIKKIAILTSGGDAPGMNACIRSVTRVALKKGIEVIGVINGYKGLVDKDFINLDKKRVSDILARGGTILGSARLPEFKEESIQLKAVNNLKEENIDALITIGGDGTYRGASALVKHGINCVGLPATIDNDIPGTDITIGFNTALNTIVDAVDKLRDTSSSHYRCSVVEVMGNRCADLALLSAISTGAEIIITRDTGYDEREILDKLNYLAHNLKKNHAIIVISEKITNVDDLAKLISQNTAFSGRATVLGHIQRGGSPTPNDRIVASIMGEKAIDILLENKQGHCVIRKDNEIKSICIDDSLKIPSQPKRNLYTLFDNLV